MISATNLYNVVEAMVPLYVAMALGYAAFIRSALTTEQCAGINHFLVLFAVPTLIFNMISSNNPFKMEIKFIIADTIQKLVVLAILSLWAKFSSKGSLAWVITLFSLATLPNTIIMGVPILRGMYGDVSEGLMVQIVVPQFVIWYVVVVFLFEYMAAHNAVIDSVADVELRGGETSDGLASVVVPVDQLTTADGSVATTIIVASVPSVRVIFVIAVKKILKIPSTYASILGLVWSFIAFRLDIELPAIIEDSLLIVSRTTIGLAMFSVGTFMARQKQFIACGYSLAILAMVMKFAVGPAVMAISSIAIGLRGTILQIGIVQAALPVAVLSFVYAEEYHQHADIMSTGVIVGILISVPITLLYYILLGL